MKKDVTKDAKICSVKKDAKRKKMWKKKDAKEKSCTRKKMRKKKDAKEKRCKRKKKEVNGFFHKIRRNA